MSAASTRSHFLYVMSEIRSGFARRLGAVVPAPQFDGVARERLRDELCGLLW